MTYTVEELRDMTDQMTLEVTDMVCSMDFTELKQAHNDVFGTAPSMDMLQIRIMHEALNTFLTNELEN